MKRLFVTGLLFVFMAVMPVFHAVADNNNPCRNLFDPNDYKGQAMSRDSNNVWRNTSIDTRDVMSVQIQVIGNGTSTALVGSYPIQNAGHYSIGFTMPANKDNFIIKHNGERFDFRIYTSTAVPEAGTYTVSFDVLSADPTTVGGVQIQNIQLERGSTATEYTPYNPLCATCDGQIENYVSATGTVTQNGTPSPDNPIEPVFYQQGDITLRKVGNYADSYDATTGKITRRVGVKVLNGTENWTITTTPNYTMDGATTFWNVGAIQDNLSVNSSSPAIGISNYLINAPVSSANSNPKIANSFSIGSTAHAAHTLWMRIEGEKTVAEWKQYLANQYAAGTPVTVYYPLATETTENWNETTYCAPNIKIATTAYNTARFSPVKTDLDSAVATIREIVTKTINQTAAIASLQADKQTRPEDACPAGKKCLLVETEENGVIVPHWFPIIEAPEE